MEIPNNKIVEDVAMRFRKYKKFLGKDAIQKIDEKIIKERAKTKKQQRDTLLGAPLSPEDLRKVSLSHLKELKLSLSFPGIQKPEFFKAKLRKLPTAGTTQGVKQGDSYQEGNENKKPKFG